MEELCLEPLLPGGALVDQHLAHPHAGAQLQYVRGRDPRLRQLAGEQQLQLQVTVGVVGLRPPLPSPLARRLGRVGEMRSVAGPLDLLDHEAPASRPLQCELGLTSRKLLKPLPHRSPRRGHDPAPPNLTRLAVERLVRDLSSMHIQCDYDRHRDLLELHRHERHRVGNTLEPRRSHYMSSLWSPVVATGGNRRQIGSPMVRNAMKEGLPRSDAPRVLERRREALACCTRDWISAANVLTSTSSTRLA